MEEKSKEKTEELKDLVVEKFCEPVKGAKKEKCEKFYDDWAGEEKSETEE